MLGTCLGLSPASVPLRRTAAGKLVSPVDFDFSVSHTARRAVVAWGLSRIGVDVERIDAGALRGVAEVFLHPSERSASEDPGLLAQLWTGKEALAKAIGTGFVAAEPKDFVFDMDDLDVPSPRRVPRTGSDRFEVVWFQTDPDHVVAVAGESR
ncbi:4'-phosphopantetheinyl transferase family protein [Actinopolymorpha pittospori]